MTKVSELFNDPKRQHVLNSLSWTMLYEPDSSVDPDGIDVVRQHPLDSVITPGSVPLPGIGYIRLTVFSNPYLN